MLRLLAEAEGADAQRHDAAHFLLEHGFELAGELFALGLFTDPAELELRLVAAGNDGQAQGDGGDLQAFGTARW